MHGLVVNAALTARQISPVRAWAARCRYPDFHRPGAYLCRHVLPHLPMRIAGGARAWWSRGGWRMRSSRPDLQTGKAPQTSTESVDPYAAASSSGTATAWSAERSPVGVMVRRPAKWGRFGPPPNAGAVDQSADLVAQPRIEHRSGAAALTGWCLDTAEGLRRAPGLPERRALAPASARCTRPRLTQRPGVACPAEWMIDQLLARVRTGGAVSLPAISPCGSYHLYSEVHRKWCRRQDMLPSGDY